tara:strand:+ start:748740 stop:749078 length:339 start_codon:yes stop_codon:yes gene_type:complete
MSRSSSLFDSGKILELVENGLTAIFIRFEKVVECRLVRQYMKDKRRIEINKEEKRRRKANIELAKSQDIAMEHTQKSTLNLSSENHQQIADRISELDNNDHEASQDADMDRD